MRIIRNDRESPRKCSLTPVRDREDLEFQTHVAGRVIDVDGALLLHCDGPPLTKDDRDRDIVLVDSSWRRLASVLRDLDGDYEWRSIPGGFVTAYPRRSQAFADPRSGLASIEALYIAYVILGRDPSGLLDGYLWRDEFLTSNRARLEAARST